MMRIDRSIFVKESRMHGKRILLGGIRYNNRYNMIGRKDTLYIGDTQATFGTVALGKIY